MLSDVQKRLLILFGYEATGEGRESFLWLHPELATRTGKDAQPYYQEEFDKWFATKRPLTQEEVQKGSWVKISDHGYTLRVRFLADGTLEERELFPPHRTWGGTWQLVSNGVLRMHVELRSEVPGGRGTYELDIFGSTLTGNECSGIEFRDSNTAPNAYFIVVHVV